MGEMRESYSIWLTSHNGVVDTLRKEIEKQAQVHKGPRFEPHVTLIGDVRVTREQALQLTRGLAAHIKPFYINFLDVSVGTSFHRCVYLLASKDEPLVAAYGAACSAAGWDLPPPFMPHLSLLYSDIDQEGRAAAAKEATARLYGGGAAYDTLLREAGFMVTSLSLWYTPIDDSTCASWTLVEEVPLTGQRSEGQ